jgi:hypothetical protein
LLSALVLVVVGTTILPDWAVVVVDMALVAFRLFLDLLTLL